MLSVLLALFAFAVGAAGFGNLVDRPFPSTRNTYVDRAFERREDLFSRFGRGGGKEARRSNVRTLT